MPGPPPQISTEQRDRVLALVAAGRSYSEVASEVFGEARLRGRVERIVRRERQEGERLPPLDGLLAELLVKPSQSEESPLDEPDSWLEHVVPLYGAMLKRRLEADLPVNGRELLALAQLEWRLENQRQVKRLNDLTRGLA
jgi:hypothetical protein